MNRPCASSYVRRLLSERTQSARRTRHRAWSSRAGAPIDENAHALAIHHDLGRIAGGLVGRTVWDAAGRVDQTVIALEHGCVNCTVREDLLPQLRRSATGHLYW